MAGRPRAMLKRIADWEERALWLMDDIIDRIPKQYANHKVRSGMFTDGEFRTRLDKLAETDTIAHRWICAEITAHELLGHLQYLLFELRKRYERNGLQLEGDGLSGTEDGAR